MNTGLIIFIVILVLSLSVNLFAYILEKIMNKKKNNIIDLKNNLENK